MDINEAIANAKFHKEKRRQAWKDSVAGYYETIKKSNMAEPLKPMNVPVGMPEIKAHVPQWVCTWCCKDTNTNPCEHCGNDHSISDKSLPHSPEWSRKTISEVECKVCGRSGPYEIQGVSGKCPGVPAETLPEVTDKDLDDALRISGLEVAAHRHAVMELMGILDEDVGSGQIFPEERNRCVQVLIESLKAKEAIDKSERETDDPAVLYKEMAHRLARIRHYAASMIEPYGIGRVNHEVAGRIIDDMTLGWEPGTNRMTKLRPISDV